MPILKEISEIIKETEVKKKVELYYTANIISPLFPRKNIENLHGILKSPSTKKSEKKVTSVKFPEGSVVESVKFFKLADEPNSRSMTPEEVELYRKQEALNLYEEKNSSIIEKTLDSPQVSDENAISFDFLQSCDKATEADPADYSEISGDTLWKRLTAGKNCESVDTWDWDKSESKKTEGAKA